MIPTTEIFRWLLISNLLIFSSSLLLVIIWPDASKIIIGIVGGSIFGAIIGTLGFLIPIRVFGQLTTLITALIIGLLGRLASLEFLPISMAIWLFLTLFPGIMSTLLVLMLKPFIRHYLGWLAGNIVCIGIFGQLTAIGIIYLYQYPILYPWQLAVILFAIIIVCIIVFAYKNKLLPFKSITHSQSL